ncbi:MAG: hypothetical protein ACE5FB_02315 [Candidatus Binatia bacterium]
MTRAVQCPQCGMPQTPGVPCHACYGPEMGLPRHIPAAQRGVKRTAQPVVQKKAKRRNREGVSGFAFRGAIGFGVGAGIASLCVASILYHDLSTGIGTLGELPLLVAGSAMSGACGGAALGWKRNIPGSSVIAALGFAVGFALPGWLFPLTLRGLQDAASFGSASDRAVYGAFLWGVVLGLAGAVGAAPLRSAFRATSRHFLLYSVLAGAIAFGLGGAAGGAVAFAYSLSSGSFHYWPFFTALFMAYIIGGTLFGAAVGFKAKSSPSWEWQGMRG